MICFAAVAIVIRPDEHWRSIDMPGTVTGRPARSAIRRATFGDCDPCCIAAPKRTSSTSPPSSPARSTAALTEKAPSVGEGVLLNEPRAALVSGVRAVETMTASRMMMFLLSKAPPLQGRGWGGGGIHLAQDSRAHPVAPIEQARKSHCDRQ